MNESTEPAPNPPPSTATGEVPTAVAASTAAAAVAVTTPPITTTAAWPADYNSYKLLGKVGQGAFASVWRAECLRRQGQEGVEGHLATAATAELTGGQTSIGNNQDHKTATTGVSSDGSCDEGSGGIDPGLGAAEAQMSQENNDVEEQKQLCAIKILDLEHVDTNFGDIRLEVQTMRLSSHPNVLSIYTSFIQSSNLWLVMQLMNKGSSLHCLQSIRMKYHKYNMPTAGRNIGEDNNSYNINNNDVKVEHDDNLEKKKQKVIVMEDHITYILHETLLGLKYIHENGQIHRDVKAGNILLDSLGNVRIADFGVSGWLVHGGSKRENTRTFVGTPCWMAPEVMEQIHGYDTKADIWSLGITAMELAKGYAPYAKYPPMKVLLLTIQEDPPSLETYLNYDDYNYDYDNFDDNESEEVQSEVVMNEEWSQSFQSMIKLCLQKSPQNRPNCDELLQHEHFQPLSHDNTRNEFRSRIKAEICDQIDNVGSTIKRADEGGGYVNISMYMNVLVENLKYC